MSTDDRALVAQGEVAVGNDPRQAAQLFAEAARIAEARMAWSHAIAARQREVGAWGRAGRRREAEGAADRALGLLGRIDDRLACLTHQSNIAVGLLDAGSSERATTLLDAVVASARALGPSADGRRLLAAALVNRATVVVDGRGGGPADALLTEAEDLVRELGDLARLGTVLINRAALASKRHDLARARELYADAADAFRRSDAGPEDEGGATRGEAATLAVAGRYSEAIQRYAAASRLFEAAGRTDEVRITQIGAVMARHSLGEPIPLDELRDMASWLADMTPMSAGQLAMNLANIAQQQGEPEMEDKLRRRAKRAFNAAGARADVARVDLGRAVALRRAGRLDRARKVILAAREVLRQEGRWVNVAHADHNLALVLDEMADRRQPPRHAYLEQAAERSLSALAALDRYRHSMPSAADRRAIGESTYPGMFATAVRANLRAGRNDVVAVVVERARIQPVLARRDDTTRFLEPAPLAALPGSPAIDGAGEPVVLVDEAERLAGPGAAWIGWWSDGRDVVRVVSGRDGVAVEVVPLERGVLDALALALPHVLPAERELAGEDLRLATRLALLRAARGPLVDDPHLAAAVERDLPPGSVESLARCPAETSDELLWPLSKMLLGESLLESLAACAAEATPRPLAVAPPAVFGRIPWAALPLADPAGCARPPLLAEGTDLVVAVPASLSAAMARDKATARVGETLLVLDPFGDLPFATAIRHGSARVLRGPADATRSAVLEALGRRPAAAAFAAHVRPGRGDDPTLSAILLAGEMGGAAPLTVTDLATIEAPPVCVLLVCDGAGAATGAEWTGVATGLLWAGAGWVVTTSAAVIEDRLSSGADSELLRFVADRGPLRGTWAWQRRCATLRRKHRDDPRWAPYRWANFIVLTCADQEAAVATG